MRVRLEPHDEFLHELGPEPNFNESMYFNVFDPAQQLGGFFRLGNRANEGQAEMTTCLYLPDGRVAFQFRRPSISHNDAFDAGGMRFTVHEPFEHLSVDYRGTVVLLDEPADMADPRTAFKQNPWVDCEVHLDYTRVSDMFGGEPEESHETPGEEFAKGHYEQLNEARGTITVGDEAFEVHGYGLRDHSWGPRFWQAPWYYRWLTANFGREFGFMASRVAKRDGPGTRGGFVWDGERLRLIEDVRIATTYDDERYHSQVEATLTARDGQAWSARGEVLRLLPLRNRRTTPEGEQLLTRISEGMTRWELPDGRVGYGLSEYLDQIIDDQPVGLAEEERGR
ncbi:MAG: hypothetical protein AAGA17_11060 [Actinomycetota bacterium]